jgi:putative FmdB family regulatory protein
MPLYDYSCKQGHVTESFESPSIKRIICPQCGGRARRIFSFGSVNTANEDAAWIRDIVQDKRGIGVVSRTSTAPHVRAFRENPTRANLKAYMKGQGIRHVEAGERFDTKPPQFDLERHHQKTWEQFQKATALDVRTR